MKKTGLLVAAIFFVFLFSGRPAWASYTLPYPSYLPGNRLYKLSRLYDQLMAYWYFGKITSVRYHLQLSDKYLVESRTLFEYGQYLLALDALDRSDREFAETFAVYAEGLSEGRDLATVADKLPQAAGEHVRVLWDLITRLPKDYVWSPEKENSQILKLHERLTQSREIREKAGNR